MIGRALLILAIGMGVGCADDGLPLVTVSGTVTFDGGPCPAKGTISFSPKKVKEGMPRRPASGKFDTDGKFSARSFPDREGLIPGEYEVVVDCYRGNPSMEIPGEFDRATFVPRDFQAAVLIVEASSSEVTYDVDVPMKK